MYELAYDDAGEPIDVPPEVTGWRVRRCPKTQGDGRPRGRPSVVRVGGKPLVLPLNATQDDLLRNAGAGYHFLLDPVNATGHHVEDVPTACAGPFIDSDDLRGDLDQGPTSDQADSPSVLARLLERTVAANTRLAQDVVGQASVMMGQTAQLLQTAHGVGLHQRVTAAQLDDQVDEIDDDADDVDGIESQRAPVIPPMIELLLDKLVNAAVPIVMGRLAKNGLGVPPEALVDWSRAKPEPPNSVAPPVSARPAHAAPADVHVAPIIDVTSLSASAGAAPIHGAAPAASSLAPDPNAHMISVWHALTDAERAVATMLVAQLTPDERTAWIAELAALTVGDAVARVRSVLAPIAQIPKTTDGKALAMPTTPSI